jgi:hypothetical protein
MTRNLRAEGGRRADGRKHGTGGQFTGVYRAGKWLQRGRDPGWIAADLVHVGECRLPVASGKRRAYPSGLLAGHSNKHGLGAGQPILDERQHVVQVLSRVTIGKGDMAQVIAAAVN